MALARPSTVALAALLASSALFHAFARHDLDPSVAVLRFLIAVPVSAAMLAVLRAVTHAYRHPGPAIRAVAERLDAQPPEAQPSGGQPSGGQPSGGQPANVQPANAQPANAQPANASQRTPNSAG
jgi:hypothetical protein